MMIRGVDVEPNTEYIGGVYFIFEEKTHATAVVLVAQ